MPSSTSSGSNPVTTMGTWYFSTSGWYSLHAHHRTYVARGEERLHPIAAVTP